MTKALHALYSRVDAISTKLFCDKNLLLYSSWQDLKVPVGMLTTPSMITEWMAQHVEDTATDNSQHFHHSSVTIINATIYW